MKNLLFQKRQNEGLMRQNFVWQKSRAGDYPDDCVPCRKKDNPKNRPCGPLHPCVSPEQNEQANYTAMHLQELGHEIMQEKNHMSVRLTARTARDGLGAVVLGLMKQMGIRGCLDYGLPVLYRSNKLTPERRAAWMKVKGNCFPVPADMPPELRDPNVGKGIEEQLAEEKAFRLSGANMIYPDQLVTLVKEGGKLVVIVSDTDPYKPGTGGGGPKGGPGKKEKPCVDCDDNLRENLFGIGSLDERVEGTLKASEIFGKELDKYQRNFEALRGYNGVIKMIQKVLMPVFAGGVLGWSVDAIDGKRNDMVKELTKKGSVFEGDEQGAQEFADKIVASMRSSIPQAKAVADKIIGHYETSQFKGKNKDMLLRDISTYAIGTMIAGGLVAAGVITAPMVSVLTASIVLTNVRMPFVKKLCVLPDVNTTMKAIYEAKNWDQMADYVDGSYTEQVKRTVKAGEVYSEQVQNFMKFENAILGGNDRPTKLTKTLTNTERAEYARKQSDIEKVLPEHIKRLGQLDVAIDGQGNFAVDQAKWAKKEFWTFVSLDRKKGVARRGIRVLMDKRASTEKGRESRKGVPENEDKIKAMHEIIQNLVDEYNQDFADKDKFGNTRIEVVGTPPRTEIRAYEGNVLIADNANFTAGRKKLLDRQGRLAAIRELHEVGTEMYEFNRLYRKNEEFKNYLETSTNSYGGVENTAENVYQNAVAGFLTEYTSYTAFAHNKTISELMDHYNFDSAPAGQKTPRELLKEYFSTRLGDKRRVEIMNDLIGRPKFRDFMKCLALMVKKCRETNCWEKWNKDLDKDSQAYVDGVKLYIDAVGPEKRRIGITWGMVEGLYKMLRPSRTTETAVMEDRVRYTDLRKDGGVLQEDVPIGSDYDQTMQWAMNNNPNIGREIYQVQTGTITNTVSQSGGSEASLAGGVGGVGLGFTVDNAVKNRKKK